MQLVVITGQARVGKTTLAKMIAKKVFYLGMKPKLLSFAGPLKKLAEEKGYNKEDGNIYRKFCQEYGAMRRDEDPDYWVKEFEEGLKHVVDTEARDIQEKKRYWEHCVIVDDCRYVNEIGLSMKYNATLIFLSFGDREVPEPDEEWRKHHSEALANTLAKGDKEYRDMFTHIILNDKTEEDLEDKIQPLVPLWCGICTPETSECTCAACRMKKNENRQDILRDSINALIDIIFIDLLNEEEDDEDEETK